ncbi:MAG: DNA polymerase domain-containing protein [Nitrososphaeria archaeon]|nr:DNA polymerase domain-containing protein [Conexivisphaerales archaeon]
MKGWLFDVYYRNGKVYIWNLSEGGTFRKLTLNYNPYIILEPLEQSIVQDLSEAFEVEIVRKKLMNGSEKDMILVKPPWELYEKTLKLIRADKRGKLYDDLKPVQKFLFNELKVEPGRRIDVESLKPLPLGSDPEPMPLYVGKDPEADIACNVGCNEVLKRSDDPVDAYQGSCAGRISMNRKATWFECSKEGLAYLLERSAFAFLPLGLAARWSSNLVIDSRNAYTLISKGYAVPEINYTEPVERLRDFLYRDRGGYTIPAPSSGVYFNVAVIDFESEYPNIIVKEDISYEGHGWLIPEVLSEWIKRRLEFKRLAKIEKDPNKKELYKARSDSLKTLLVSEYGISGCSLNRFGNHFAFEEINRISREIMVKAKETAESMGFSVIYGDVDSIFVYKSGSGENEYKELARVISERAEIPAALDKIFRSIAFMRTRSVKGLTAIKRYFGITEDGEIEARGIELRRSDTPELIKAFQKELIKSIYACSSYEEAQKRALNLAPVILSKYIEIIREKSVKVDSLVINKRLGKDPYSYKANVAQKILGLTLGAKAEEKISFVLGRNGPELDLENYDWKKYYKMIFRAAETVLAPLDIRPSLELRLDAL